MSSHARVPAVEPEDLERLFVEPVNAGDVEGLVELLAERRAVVAALILEAPVHQEHDRLAVAKHCPERRQLPPTSRPSRPPSR